jgi:F420-dependent oxidoreductase-like protein
VRPRFGIVTDQNLPWPTLVERWQYFESLGFDSIWNCDHFIQPSRPSGPYFEAWTLLAALAARTERVRLGVLVTSNTFRHPALLAKQAITVDHISDGRLELGLGAGWYEPEHAMFGLAFPAAPELVSRFGEAVEVVDRLLRDEISTYAGRHYQLHEAASRPRPIQLPRPPLTLAAHRSNMLRIVAQYADAWNSFGTVAEMRARNDMLDEHCAASGRDRGQIRRGLYGWATMMPTDPWASQSAFDDMVGRYSEAGVNEFLIDQPRTEQFAVLERVAADLLRS